MFFFVCFVFLESYLASGTYLPCASSMDLRFKKSRLPNKIIILTSGYSDFFTLVLVDGL